MNGEPDLYVAARRILLDALSALHPHLDSIVLVGAQAIYLHTGDGEVAVGLYTRDADMALNPRSLASTPAIEGAMRGGGFSPAAEPGRWIKEEIPVDLMVPEALAGPGRRGADLGSHGRTVARRARGLEGALIDNGVLEIKSLEERDARRLRVAVAGPGALLVAKLHKIAERAGTPSRLQDKDALDVLRLLRTVKSEILVGRLRLLVNDDLARETTARALPFLRDFFGRRNGLAPFPPHERSRGSRTPTL